MSLSSPDGSASRKDGNFAIRLSSKWSDIFGASCPSSVKWKLLCLTHQGTCKRPKEQVLFIFNLQVNGQRKQCSYDEHFLLGQNNTWFSYSNFCLLSVPWCHPHNDRVFQKLSALIQFWSVCLRIEKRFKTRGVEPAFISFNSNPIMRPCKSLSLLQLFCFRDSQEEVQELEGWETSPQHHTHSTCSALCVFGAVGRVYWETWGDWVFEDNAEWDYLANENLSSWPKSLERLSSNLCHAQNGCLEGTTPQADIYIYISVLIVFVAGIYWNHSQSIVGSHHFTWSKL